MRRWIKYVYATMHATAQNSSAAASSAGSEGAHLKERLKWLAGDHLGQRAELREEAGESEGALADKLYVPVQGASQSGTLEAAAVTERKSAKRHT
jgi:hypothetical protein